MSERNFVIYMDCVMCGTQHEIKVRFEDYLIWDSPNRPHIQDIFPYLTPAERELLISGTCNECWEKMFPPEPDDFDDEEDSENE